jgi:hypothetical protein
MNKFTSIHTTAKIKKMSLVANSRTATLLLLYASTDSEIWVRLFKKLLSTAGGLWLWDYLNESFYR